MGLFRLIVLIVLVDGGRSGGFGGVVLGVMFYVEEIGVRFELEKKVQDVQEEKDDGGSA